MVTSSSPERSNDQLLSAAISSTTASGLFGESMMLSRRGMPSRPYFFEFRYDGDTHAAGRHALVRRVAAGCNPTGRLVGFLGLPGSSDVICGIRATAPGVHPQAKRCSSTTLRAT